MQSALLAVLIHRHQTPSTSVEVANVLSTENVWTQSEDLSVWIEMAESRDTFTTASADATADVLAGRFPEMFIYSVCIMYCIFDRSHKSWKQVNKFKK